MPSARSTTVEVPEKPSQSWLYPSGEDKTYLICCLVLLPAFLIGIKVFGLWLWLAMTASGYIQLSNGRVYYTINIKLKSAWLDHVQKGVIWEARPAHPRKARLLRRIRTPNDDLIIDLIDDLPLIHNNKDKTDTLIVVGEGSDIASYSIDGQAMINERIARGIRRIAAAKKGDIIVSQLNSRRPSDNREMFGINSANLHPDYLRHEPDGDGTEWPEPDISDGDANIRKVVEELLELNLHEVNRNTMAWAITIQRDDLLRKLERLAKEGKVAEDDGTPFAKQVADTTVEVLTNCGVDEAHPFSIEEMHEHIRYSWDVIQDDDYASAQAEPDFDPLTSKLLWPRYHILAYKGSCVMDGSHHAVLRVIERPDEAEPDDFRGLLALNAHNVTIAQVARTTRSGKEVFGLEVGKTLWELVQDKLGVTSETQRQLARAERNQSRLETASKAGFTQYCTYVAVVSTADPSTLEDDVEAVARSIRSIDGFDSKRIDDSYLQVPWVLTAHGALL